MKPPPPRDYRFIGPTEPDAAGTRPGSIPGAKLEQPASLPDDPPKPRPASVKSATPLLALVAATGILLVVWRKLKSPLPIPHVISSAQITKDRLPKSHATLELVTDGSR